VLGMNRKLRRAKHHGVGHGGLGWATSSFLMHFEDFPIIAAHCIVCERAGSVMRATLK
jgi:hypothetical protein